MLLPLVPGVTVCQNVPKGKLKPKQRPLTEAHPRASIVGVLKKRKMGVLASIVNAISNIPKGLPKHIPDQIL
jgi:hypothetical protein